jgi:hypothetical protein
MRHDGTANLVIGRRRCGRKKALHYRNNSLFGEQTTAGASDLAAENARRKPLICIG